MKHIKIDIKQEILDLNPRPYYDFFQLDEEANMLELIDETDKYSKMLDIKRLTYRVRELYNPVNGKRTRYLIQEDDYEIIENLIQIYKDDLERYVQKRIDEKEGSFVYRGKSDENYRIKNIKWWSRLFNKF